MASPRLVSSPDTSVAAEPARRADAGFARARLTAWLVDAALPLWSTAAVDRAAGGFFEKMDDAGRPVEEPRRTRVVARQIYVFATAARHDWSHGADALIDHGIDFLLGALRQADATFAASVHVDGRVAQGAFDLYEHAFALFALASAFQRRPDRLDLVDAADAALARMHESWKHPAAGFHESAPPTLPLKSNPHMHLLEAALAWVDASDVAARAGWQALADEIVELCLSRLITEPSGAVHEYFDADWRPMPGDAGRVIEPGHQFEWAWLLLRWGRATGRADAIAAAHRLMAIGEAHGVDAGRGVAINELHDVGSADEFRLVDPVAKLWPQTERIKAWTSARAVAETPADVARAETKIAAAIDGLMHFVDAAPVRGLWREQMRHDGSFAVEPTRASSLYHIVCAIDTLHGVDGRSIGVADASRMTPGASPRTSLRSSTNAGLR